MSTMDSNFLARVQAGKQRFPNDVEFLHCAQHAGLGDRGEGAAPVEDLPGDVVGRPSVLDFPDVGA